MSSEWPEQHLGVIADWYSGGTPSKNNPSFWDGTIPWISAKSMSHSRVSDSEDKITLSAVQSKNKIVDTNSILILVRGSTLHQSVPICITTKPVTFNQDVKALVAKPTLDPFFLFYSLLANSEKIHNLVEFTGIGAGKLDTTRLKSILIPTSSLNEQLAISRIFISLDDKIELNRQMNETLEAMARAIFKSWFVDFDPVRAKAEKRDTGLPLEIAALFPDGFEEVDGREVPRGWELKEIRTETSVIQYGLTQSASQEEIGPKFLRITDIQGGKINWDHVPYCAVSPDDFEKYRINIGDIFVARTGASTGENIFIIDASNSVFPSYLVRFQFKVPGIARVVGEFMRTESYFDFVSNAIGGSAQPNASAQVLASASFVFPTADIAEAFLKMVAPLDKMRAINEKQSSTLAQIRDALLPKLCLGKFKWIIEINSRDNNMKEHIVNFLNKNRDVIFPYIELIQSIFPFLLPVCLALANNQILSIIVKDKNLQGFVVSTTFICLITFVLILITCAIIKKLTPVSDKDEQIEILQTRIIELSEENRDWVEICYETIDAPLHSLASGPLKFGEKGTHTERISLYIHDDDFQKFIQLGRVSLNPDYCKLGKRVYSEDEGCLGYTWNNGEGFRNDYADPEMDLPTYLEQMKHESLNKNIVKAFNMKSRLYYGYRVMDTKKRNCLAVIIVESTDPSRYSKEDLHKVFGVSHRASFISRIIEKLYPCLPKLQNAKEEGF